MGSWNVHQPSHCDPRGLPQAHWPWSLIHVNGQKNILPFYNEKLPLPNKKVISQAVGLDGKALNYTAETHGPHTVQTCVGSITANPGLPNWAVRRLVDQAAPHAPTCTHPGGGCHPQALRAPGFSHQGSRGAGLLRGPETPEARDQGPSIPDLTPAMAGTFQATQRP